MRVCILTVGRSAFSQFLYTKEAASLQRAGHDVVIVAPCLEGEDPSDPDTNFLGIRILPLMRMGWGTRKQKLLNLPRLLTLGWRQQCDIYQVMEPQSLLVGAVLRLVTRRPLVYDSREYYPLSIAVNTGLGPTATRLIHRCVWLFESALILLFVSHVFAVDHVAKRRFRRLRRQTSLLLNYPTRDFVPQPADTNGQLEAATAEPFQFLYAGYTRRRNAVLETITAIALMRDAGIDARATFLGTVDDEPFVRRCNEKIEALRVEHAVRLIGRVSHKEVARYLRTADCGSLLYLPTPYTEYAIHVVKLFEYMAFGLPVVCSDFPNMARLVREERCGLVVDATNPRSIAEALMYLIQHPVEARQFGCNGRRAFRERYHWEVLEPRYVRVFERLNPRPARVVGRTQPNVREAEYR